MHNLTVFIITSVSILLLIAAFTLFISKYSRLPFTILLVIIGYLVSHLATFGPDFLQPLAHYKIHPDIILYACLPTLIFESAFTMDTRLLRRNLTPVLTLAIPGLFLSTTVIGTLVWLFTPLSVLVALLLGAILSATDPVAVISLFKQLGVPKRLTILVEGESLFNDSTAIVTAKTILMVILAGAITLNTFYLGVYQFCIEFFGGILVGMAMAFITGYAIAWIEEPVAELSLTIILAYLSFIVADELFHVSGVMATITAGIVMAGWGRTKISAATDQHLRHLLEFLAYIANALIFLLVGLSINLSTLSNSIFILSMVIFAMLVSRALVIYGLIPLIGKLPNAQPINKRYQTIMWWGGLRGAIALAIVLGLNDLPDQELLITLVMGAVLFTILVQGLSINRIIHWLRLDQLKIFDRFIQIETELVADKMTLDRIPELQSSGLFSYKIAQDLQTNCEEAIETSRQALQVLREKELDKKQEKRLLFLICFAAEKHLYYEMFNKGHLSERAYRILNHDIELEIDLMRYTGAVAEKVPIGIMKKISEWLINAFDYLPLLNKLGKWMRISQMVNDYEEIWGLHQGSVAVLNHLDEIAKLEYIKSDATQEVREQFRHWLTTTTKYLDNMTEQFPEFVHDMQQRLAKRLLLQAKYESVARQAQQGLLPAGVADVIIKKYVDELRELRKSHPEKLRLDPHELLRKVPFFKDVPENEADQILSLLKEYYASAGEILIREHEQGDTFYLIMRGVVRIIKEKDGQEINVATLMAGDFFGEMALIYKTKRTATCKAVTPCLLYTLNRSAFEQMRKKFPAIDKAIAETAAKRTQN